MISLRMCKVLLDRMLLVAGPEVHWLRLTKNQDPFPQRWEKFVL